MPIISTFIMPHPPIILPEIGRGQEKIIQKTFDSCQKIAMIVRELAPDTIIVISSHSQMYSDYFHISPGKKANGDLHNFRADNVKINAEYDVNFVRKLETDAGQINLSAGTLGEQDPDLDHGVIIPLYFINQHYNDYKLVRIGLSGLSISEHYKLGQCIADVSQKIGRKYVIIASGDLSHRLKADGPYGFAPEGPIFDKAVTEAMAAGDFLTMMTFDQELTGKAAECGLKTFIIMAGALDAVSVDARLLSYEGTFGVGYATATFAPLMPDESRSFLKQYQLDQSRKMLSIKGKEDDFVRLARLTLESTVNSGKHVSKLPELTQRFLRDRGYDLPSQLTQGRAGVFVSIKKHGSLRGCIGTISPVTSSIAEEIIHNAISAGMSDPRFDPVTKDELDDLVYSVDVLMTPESIDSSDELDPAVYGVIVSKGLKRGLLLPALEGVDTVEEQLSIALKKAGIGKHQSYSLERFKVERHK